MPDLADVLGREERDDIEWKRDAEDRDLLRKAQFHRPARHARPAAHRQRPHGSPGGRRSAPGRSAGLPTSCAPRAGSQRRHAPRLRDVQRALRILWFEDRIEVTSPGGPYGIVTKDTFDQRTDYRNPALAAAIKTLGYVNRFGRGITLVRMALEQNGNPPAEFQVEDTYWSVTVRRAL